MSSIASVQLRVGLEIHVELCARTKMFTRVPNGAHPEHEHHGPNELIDPVVLGLPGALPVLNKKAIDSSIMVGLALGCSIAELTKWDRKSYFYPDMPKNYQISQYDLPLCFDGSFDLPDPADPDGVATRRIGIIRAHLEEDAGKLLHEAPGGFAIDHSIVDLNRAGTPLLEIVTAPDFRTSDEVVAFAQTLRNICRFLGVTEGVMQKGHMRFEPNINCLLTLSDGRLVTTPIVEVKNLNSFKSLRGAIEFELRDQPGRWQADGRVMGPATKTTRGWDDVRNETYVQREKEDAHDYRYFPDPDLPMVRVDEAWRERLRASLPELPHVRRRRYEEEYGIGAKEAAALVEEREVCFFYELATEEVEKALGEMVRSPEASARAHAARLAANYVLQSGFKRANERGMMVHQLGISARRIGQIAALREAGEISAAGADALFGELCERDDEARDAAERLGLLQVRDNEAVVRWVEACIQDAANDKAVADVRAGRQQAIGRLVGDVMKRSGGKADAKQVREILLALLS